LQTNFVDLTGKGVTIRELLNDIERLPRVQTGRRHYGPVIESPQSAVEPVLLPQQKICDPHHHLWRHKGVYEVAQLLADFEAPPGETGHNIVSTVFVACEAMYREDGPEAMRPVGETEYVEAMAASNPRDRGDIAVAEGIVGFADLLLGDRVAPVLEAHVAASATRFRGIRHTTTWDQSPAIRTSAPYPRAGVMLEPAFRQGVRRLSAYRLVFDAWLFHPQIPELSALAAACPDVPIVIDHMGLPLGVGPYAGHRDEVFANWSRDIAVAARMPNVCVKLGGFGMPRSGFGWESRTVKPDAIEIARALKPYVMHCIEQFGTSRCMFESNFPVDKISYSYHSLWNAFKRLTSSFSEQQCADLFHDTASRFYRLSDHGT